MPVTPLTYRTDDNDKWGAGKGDDLDPVEVDLNFWILWSALAELLDELPEGVGIADIQVAGSLMTISLTDSSTRGPFELPTAVFRWRGLWATATEYAPFDVVQAPGLGVFLALRAHVSAGAFDPEAEDDTGPLWHFLFGLGVSPVVTVEAAELTVTAAHGGSYLRCTNAGGCAVTLPDGLAEGAEVRFRQAADGASVFSAGDGAAIEGVDGFLNETGRRGAVVTAKHVGGGVWDLFGDLAPEPEPEPESEPASELLSEPPSE